jgi:hypothetical protein
VLRGGLVDFLAVQQSRESYQARAQQAERARLRYYDVGIAARDRGRTVEEAFAGVDRELHCHTVGVEATESPAQRSRERVIVGAIGQGDERPGNWTAKRS